MVLEESVVVLMKKVVVKNLVVEIVEVVSAGVVVSRNEKNPDDVKVVENKAE